MKEKHRKRFQLTKVLQAILPLALSSAFNSITFPTIPWKTQTDTSSRIAKITYCFHAGKVICKTTERTSGCRLGKKVSVVLLLRSGQRWLGRGVLRRLAWQLHGSQNCQMTQFHLLLDIRGSGSSVSRGLA